MTTEKKNAISAYTQRLEENTDALISGSQTFEAFEAKNRTIWDEIAADDVSLEVLAWWRSRNAHVIAGANDRFRTQVAS